MLTTWALTACGGGYGYGPTASKTGGARRTGPSGLKAGYADDNKQYNYFLGFLKKYRSLTPYHVNVSERIILRLKDGAGKSIPNATITIFDGETELTGGRTYADGTFLFFPARFESRANSYRVRVQYENRETSRRIERRGKRLVTIRLQDARKIPATIPLDILFIFDTTGSMGEEIARLKRTIEIIHANLSAISPRPRLRFGMTLYRDKGDDYRTKIVPLTADLQAFQNELDEVRAGGGGDGPEDLQEALNDSLTRIQWNRDGLRLAFIITDAAPHLDYGQNYTYIKSAFAAKKRGIKLFSLGTGGLPTAGEYVLRQISQLTYARYIFLTYGERGESKGGRTGSVSHHTGANFISESLEKVILRFAREELSRVSRVPIRELEDYFTAKKIKKESREKTLSLLFDRTIKQLVDYSSLSIKDRTAIAVLPLESRGKSHRANAEYFTEQVQLALSKNKKFALTERKNLKKILREIALRSSGLTREKKAVKIGGLLGAELLLTGNLYREKTRYSLFLKLVRVRTGEILSVTKARIDRRLGVKSGKK